MANTRGGQIVLGIKESADGMLELHGLAEPERVERELWNQLQNRQKVSANLLQQADVEHHLVEGKRILVVHVPRADRKHRPIYLQGDWMNVYVRVGDGDRRLDRDRVRRMLADAEYDTRDDWVLGKFTLSDLDPESLAAYRNVFHSSDPTHPWLALGDQQLLEQLGGYRRDRESGEEGLTSAGLLFFGREPSIREVFTNYFVDYQERAALDDHSRWLDRITADGTWSGNVFDFFRKVFPRLEADLKVPFELATGLVRRDETQVGEALREALVNALIHADYEGRTSILVVKARDGFLLRNPGTLRLSIDEIRVGGRSDCRNRALQRMFARVGLGEQTGSGFARILRAWREQHWVAPLIADDQAGEFTTLRLSLASLFSQDVVQRLQARFGDRFTGLDENGRLAVATAEVEGRVTNARLQGLTAAHPRDLTVLLQQLVGHRACWRHTATGVAHGIRPRASYGSRLAERRGSPGWPRLLSSKLSHRLLRKPPRKPPPQTLPQSASVGPGSALVADVAAQRWVRRARMREAVLEVCRGRFVSARAIAATLRRSVRTIADHYLPELVEAGCLELKEPENPSSADQAYRTVEADHEYSA